MSPSPLPRARRPRLRHPLALALLVALLATASAGGWHWVRVRPGDTLWSIAASHHTTVAELVALNHLPGNGELIYAGSRVKVPTRHHHAARHHHTRRHHHVARRHHTRRHHHVSRPAGQRWVLTRYTVRSGDTLDAICARYSVDPARIARANGLSSSLVVRIGQRLKIWHWGHHTHRHRARHHVHHHARRHHRHFGVPGWVEQRRAELARMAVPSRDAVGRMIATTARRFGVDPRFAMAIAWQESGFNQREVSGVGAIGAMQVMPATGVFVSTYIVHRPLHLMSAADNVTAGVGLLSALLAATHGNERMSAAGYYQGLDSVRHNGMFSDTKRYVANVLALRQRF